MKYDRLAARWLLPAAVSLVMPAAAAARSAGFNASEYGAAFMPALRRRPGGYFTCEVDAYLPRRHDEVASTTSISR